MARGRGSAVPLKMLALCTIMFVVSIGFADAAKYTVGDVKGWTFNVSNWPADKKFVAGDVLVFKYPPGAHNVFVVDESGYSSCTSKEGDKWFISGNDEIVLQKGKNFFICSFPSHCARGMKVAIDIA